MLEAARYGHSGGHAQPAAPAHEPLDEAATPLLELLRERTGLRPQSVAAQQLLATLQRRGQGSAPALAALHAQALQSAAAFGALVESAVVPETWFFRDPAAFDALADAVRRRAPTAAPYRVLCVPCSTGEEAWTLALTLQRAGLQSSQYELLALDIAAPAIERARRGLYGASSFRGIEPGQCPALCQPAGRQWQVLDSLRPGLRFERANLLELDPATLGGEFDAVFCRNLLIYLDTAARQRVAQLLRALTVPERGLLFVGPAEAADAFGGTLQRLDWPLSFGFCNRAAPAIQRGAAKRPAARPPGTSTAAPSGSAASAPRTSAGPWQPLPQRPAPSLAEVNTLADRGDLACAWVAAQALLAAQPLLADAHALLGLLAQTRDEPALARRCFQNALFLDPQHRQSLQHLMLAATAAGASDEAERLRLRLARAQAQAEGST